MNSSRAPFGTAEFHVSSPKFGAALEVLGHLTMVAAATLGFFMGWLSRNQAAMVTAVLLLSLTGLAWHRFDGGRHPCFFFLCMLTLFQGGRLIAYGAGGETDIFRVTLMTSEPFDVSRNVAASTLLLIALSAICIYAPCRWNYRPLSPSRSGSFGRFLPYLYLLFSLSVPVQLYKNFCYYQYAKDHGGYLVVFIDHGGMAASIPIAVRAISLIRTSGWRSGELIPFCRRRSVEPQLLCASNRDRQAVTFKR